MDDSRSFQDFTGCEVKRLHFLLLSGGLNLTHLSWIRRLMNLGARSDGSDLSSISLIQRLSGHRPQDPTVWIPSGFCGPGLCEATTPWPLAAPSPEFRNAEITKCTFSWIRLLSVLWAKSKGCNSFAFSALFLSFLNWIFTSNLFAGRILRLLFLVLGCFCEFFVVLAKSFSRGKKFVNLSQNEKISWILWMFPPSVTIFHKIWTNFLEFFKHFYLLKQSFMNLWRVIVHEYLLFLLLQSLLPRSFEHRALYFLVWASYDVLSVWRTTLQALWKNCVRGCQFRLCAVRIMLLSILCEEAYCWSFDTMINSGARNEERKNWT